MTLHLCTICGRWELLNEETEILCHIDEDHGTMTAVQTTHRIFVQFEYVVDIMGKTPYRDAKITPYEELVRQVQFLSGLKFGYTNEYIASLLEQIYRRDQLLAIED